MAKDATGSKTTCYMKMQALYFFNEIGLYSSVCQHTFPVVDCIILRGKGEGCFAFILLNALTHTFSFVLMKAQTSLPTRHWLTTLQTQQSRSTTANMLDHMMCMHSLTHISKQILIFCATGFKCPS